MSLSLGILSNLYSKRRGMAETHQCNLCGPLFFPNFYISDRTKLLSGLSRDSTLTISFRVNCGEGSRPHLIKRQRELYPIDAHKMESSHHFPLCSSARHLLTFLHYSDGFTNVLLHFYTFPARHSAGAESRMGVNADVLGR